MGDEEVTFSSFTANFTLVGGDPYTREVTEQTACTVNLIFQDEDNDYLTPNSLSYILYDKFSGTIRKSATIIPSSHSQNLTFTIADNTFINDLDRYEINVLLVRFYSGQVQTTLTFWYKLVKEESSSVAVPYVTFTLIGGDSVTREINENCSCTVTLTFYAANGTLLTPDSFSYILYDKFTGATRTSGSVVPVSYTYNLEFSTTHNAILNPLNRYEETLLEITFTTGIITETGSYWYKIINLAHVP